MNTLERALVEKAACEQGWENVVESLPAAIILSSARHKAQIRVMSLPTGQGWQVELPQGLIRKELARSLPTARNDDGIFTAGDMDDLAVLFRRAAELAVSLPNQAALTYRQAVSKELENIQNTNTEIERLVKKRVGQDTFRQALIDYWGGSCAVTGIDVPEVLRASHAKPWAICESDEERLNVFNGFLLTANLDALFDRGIITFDDSGVIICSSEITFLQRQNLLVDKMLKLRWLAPEHLPFLSWHRDNVFRHKILI